MDALLIELTPTDKASLTSGSAAWYTVPVERLGIPRIMVPTGPHRLRTQPGEDDHAGLWGLPARDVLPEGLDGRVVVEPRPSARTGEALVQEARAVRLS